MKPYTSYNIIASQENNTDFQDRISNLPDDVLSYVLTFINVKEAVRTRILPRRWRYLYVPMSNLVFDHTLISSVEFEKNLLDFEYCGIFVDRVEKILKTITDQKPLTTLKVRFPLAQEFAFDIDNWLSLAVSKECEEIELDLDHATCDSNGHYFEPYNFPSHILSLSGTSHLKSLFLRECAFQPPPEVANYGLHSLKSLILNNVHVEPSDLKIILSGFLNLEFLGLLSCPLLSTLHIFGPRLKFLILKFMNVFVKIELNVPNLEVFEFEGWLPTFTLSRFHRKLKNASLNIYGSSLIGLGEMLDELARYSPHLQSLSLKLDSNQSINYAYIKDHAPLFCDLTYLELSINGYYEWIMLMDILCRSHQLEVLHVDKDFCHHIHGDLSWIHSQPVPRCMSTCLRKVRFQHFYGQHCELKFAQYILENARALERMVIMSSGVERTNVLAIHQIVNKVEAFPRGSEACEILFY